MLRPRGKCLILMALLLGDDLAGSIDQSALDLVSSELLSELDYGQEAVNAQRFRQGLADIACHFIQRTLNSCLKYQTAPYAVASNKRRATLSSKCVG